MERDDIGLVERPEAERGAEAGGGQPDATPAGPAGLDDAPLGAVAEPDDLIGGGLDDALGMLEGEEADEEAPGDGGDRVVPFDFSRPHGLARGFEHRLRNLGETLAKATTISYTGLFRTSTVLEFAGVTLRPCADYLRALPTPTCVAALRLPPLKGQALLHLDLALCFSLLKKLMGGAVEVEEAIREFTEIERSLLGNLLAKLAVNLREAGARLLPLEPEVVGLENNPEYLGGIVPEDTLVQLRFKLKLEPVAGDLELSLPLSGFEPVRHLFEPSEDQEQRSEQEARRDRRLVADLLRGTDCDLVARLGELDLSLDRVVRLREGDLLPLPQRVDEPLAVMVDDRPLFLAEPGRLGRNRAVKLVRRLADH